MVLVSGDRRPGIKARFFNPRLPPTSWALTTCSTPLGSFGHRLQAVSSPTLLRGFRIPQFVLVFPRRQAISSLLDAYHSTAASRATWGDGPYLVQVLTKARQLTRRDGAQSFQGEESRCIVHPPILLQHGPRGERGPFLAALTRYVGSMTTLGRTITRFPAPRTRTSNASRESPASARHSTGSRRHQVPLCTNASIQLQRPSAGFNHGRLLVSDAVSGSPLCTCGRGAANRAPVPAGGLQHPEERVSPALSMYTWPGTIRLQLP
jgi:hypothetical protein